MRDARIRGLYAVLDASVAASGADGEEALDAPLAEALAGGCRLFQYRDKGAPARLLLARARRIAGACREAGALLIVNDRLDVALLAGADGCHLGQDDLPIAAARKLSPAGFLLGASTHGPDEARQAQDEGADYVGVGAVFPTTSKEDARAPEGPGLVAEVVAAVSVPAVAIGGITPGNVREVIRAGAAGAAVISALFAGGRTKEKTREFLAIWEEGGTPR